MKHMQNPAFMGRMASLEMQAALAEAPSSITKERAKEMLIFVEQSKQEIRKPRYDLEMVGSASLDMTMQLMIDHTKGMDMLYEKYRVEEAELERAIVQN